MNRVLLAAALCAEVRGAPREFVYRKDAADHTEHLGGECTMWSWDGEDSYGMTAPPWASLVSCEEGGQHRFQGVADGDLQIWLVSGAMLANNKSLARLGESFWAAAGAHIDVTISGSAYIIGAKFRLQNAPEAVFTSSWLAPRSRTYELSDAVEGKNKAALGHDDHICNGSSPSMDFVFGSKTGVDPASVVVLNCGTGSSPESNFVWSHFHPFGAVYMPFSGSICFASDSVTCVEPGTPRWVSPNLQYYEYFQKINKTNAMADEVRDLAGVPAADCEHPNVFAVTNFDAASGAGVPNFADWPENAHGTTSAAGIGSWGVFPRMTVQATRVVIGSIEVDADDSVLV